MAISAARFYGVSVAKIRKALASFQGIARRQEVRGEARGVKVIDDFGHHPTAIRKRCGAAPSLSGPSFLGDLRAALEHDPARGFSAGIAGSAELADGVFISAVARLEQIPEKGPAESRSGGRAIADRAGRRFTSRMRRDRRSNRAAAEASGCRDVFSNGGFDGIHEKLLSPIARNSVAAVYDRRSDDRRKSQATSRPTLSDILACADIFYHGMHTQSATHSRECCGA